MLLTEFDEEAFAETMREEGREEGEARVNQLYSRLVEEKRTNDLNRAIKDNGFRKELYKKWHGISFKDLKKEKGAQNEMAVLFRRMGLKTGGRKM